MSREDIFDIYERETYDDTKPEGSPEPTYCQECGDEIEDPDEEFCEHCAQLPHVIRT